VDVELPDNYILQGRVEFDEFAVAELNKCLRSIPTAHRRDLRALRILLHKDTHWKYVNEVLLQDMDSYGIPTEVTYAGVPVFPHSEIKKNAVEVYGPDRHENIIKPIMR
jgi:hypothetical protein